MADVQQAARRTRIESAELPSADAVAAFLSENPDFLQQRPDLIDVLTPPSRDEGDTVVDFQKLMVERLRGEMDSLRDSARSLIDTSRDNMHVLGRTHSAVITLLDTTSFDQGAQVVGDDLRAILDVDAATIGFEETDLSWLDTDAVRHFSIGEVDRMLGENREVRLLPDAVDDGSVFGDDAPLIRSCLLVRLHMRAADGTKLPAGILALGSRTPGAFHPEQGTEMVTFLARVLEKCAQQWTLQA